MATAAEARTLQNYAGGDWFDSVATEALDDRDPATGELTARVPLSVAADVDRAVAAARAAQPAWREVPPQERARARPGAPRRADPESPGAHRARHRRHGQDPRRRGRRGRPRHRVGRVGGRYPPPAQGRDARGSGIRHRRRAGPPARRGGRRDHPLQLPGDDPALVPALRRRLRQRLRPQALRAGSPALPANLRADRRGRDLPAGRRQPRPRRPGGGRVDPGSRPGGRGLLRRPGEARPG